METTQPGTPWTMWSRTTETTGRCDGMASHAALDNRSRRESCLVNYRTREYNRSGENVRNGGSVSVDCFYFVLTIDMPSVQFLGCWGVILWKYDVVWRLPGAWWEW